MIKSSALFEHNCYEPVEKLYYSADLEPICIYCSSEDIVAEGIYGLHILRTS